MNYKKTKVFFFHSYSKLGGADLSIARLINFSDTKKFDIEFLSLNKPKIKELIKKQIKYNTLNNKRTITSIFSLRKLAKKNIQSDKFKKIIFISNQFHCNLTSIFALFFLRNIKLVLFERNHPDVLKYSNNVLSKLKNFCIKILIKFFYKNADLILANTKESAYDWSKISGKKVINIYNPAYDKKVIKLSKKKINKKFSIINIGRLEDQKDHATLIKAFELIKNKKNLNLLIIGYGSLKENIQNLIVKFKLQKKIKILSNISNPYPYLKNSKLLVLSSKYEGFPNVIAESIMLNTPVISANCRSGPKEILLNGSGGELFNVGDHYMLSKKIENFFKDQKPLKKKLIVAKKNIYRFNAKIISNKFWGLIENI